MYIKFKKAKIFTYDCCIENIGFPIGNTAIDKCTRQLETQRKKINRTLFQKLKKIKIWIKKYYNKKALNREMKQ
jgi:hypothetical protein